MSSCSVCWRCVYIGDVFQACAYICHYLTVNAGCAHQEGKFASRLQSTYANGLTGIRLGLFST